MNKPKTLSTTFQGETYTATATLPSGPGGEGGTRWTIGNFSHKADTPQEAEDELRAQLDALNKRPEG